MKRKATGSKREREGSTASSLADPMDSASSNRLAQTSPAARMLPWPPRLKHVLRQQLTEVRGAGKMPPLISSLSSASDVSLVAAGSGKAFVEEGEKGRHGSVHSVQSFLTKVKALLDSRYPSHEEKTTTRLSLNFLLDCFECCCAAELLTPRERTVVLPVVKRQKGGKKKRAEDMEGIGSSAASPYGSVLTCDYLLRFLALLPQYMDSYCKLYEGGLFPPVEEAFWTRVNFLIHGPVLSTLPFVPVANYIPTPTPKK